MMSIRDVKVGDKIHVMGEVKSVDTKDIFTYQVAFDISRAFWLKESEVVHVEPRPLKVGDRVWASGQIWRVIAIDEDMAWIRHAEQSHSCAIYSVSLLERVPDACGSADNV